jgi:hypothetical protein
VSAPADPRAAERTRVALLADRSLILTAEGEALGRVVEQWVPRYRVRLDGEAPPAERAEIRVAPDGADGVRRPAEEVRRTFVLDTIETWVDDGARTATMASVATGAAGIIDLEARRATIGPGEPPGAPRADADAARLAWDVYSMLTASAALLLGRLHRALVHAGAVVTPGGRGWLLVGDAFAGKSTTCANLIIAGWDYVSDDQGVLSRDDSSGTAGRLRIEGWPRTMHMDEAWERGEAPLRRRRDFDPSALGPGRWRADAPVAGMLFPRVEANAPTTLLPLPQGAALAQLLRQTPWLMADRVAAPEILAILRAAAALPAYELRLGLDTYKDGALLAKRLEMLGKV